MADTSGPCMIDPINKIIFKLAHEANAACGWSINQIAEEAILKKCEKAPISEGIKFSTGNPVKIRFTQMTSTFDGSDAFFFCKNKLGYETYRTQLISSMNQEVDAQARLKYETENRNKKTVTSAPAPAPVQKVTKWKCTLPINKHIKPRIYSPEEKETLDAAYDGMEGYACLPYKRN